MNSYTFVAEGAPRSKGRPRLTRKGKAYTPAATHNAEKVIAEQYAGPSFIGPVSVVVDYFKGYQRITISEVSWDSRLTADVDNLSKLTLDALQSANAFANDRQVMQLMASKH